MSEQGLTCQEVIELLSSYIEGGLTADDRRRVDEHLALCDGCTTYLEQMRETIRLSGRLSEEAIDPEFRDRLLAAFRGLPRE